jgi:hypothetical protein
VYDGVFNFRIHPDVRVLIPIGDSQLTWNVARLAHVKEPLL